MTTLKTVDDYIDAKLVHSLHTSTAKSFRGCRRRWNWLYNEYYYPTETAKPLEFGVAFHVAMEKLYDPLTWDDKPTAYALARAAFVKTCDEQFERFKRTHGDPEPEVVADYAERRKLGLGMLQYYYEKVIPKFDHQFRPVRVEVKFEVPVKDPDGNVLRCYCDDCWRRFRTWTEVNWPEWEKDFRADIRTPELEEEYRTDGWVGLPVTYGGRIDMLAEDEDGWYWVFDWKTAAQMTKDEQDFFLQLEDQITRYVWAMRECKLPVAGFVWAEIRKAVPAEPEPLSRPYKGRLYSANKQTPYDVEVYEQTVKEGDPSGYFNGLYDVFIEYLKGEGMNTFHKRHQVHRGDVELDSCAYNIWLEACEMTAPNLRIYPSPGRFTCNGCAFAEPCLGLNRGEDVAHYMATMYEKKDRHYYDEKPLSTDKTGRG